MKKETERKTKVAKREIETQINVEYKRKYHVEKKTDFAIVQSYENEIRK